MVLLIKYLPGDYRVGVEFSVNDVRKSLKIELNAARLRTHKPPGRGGGELKCTDRVLCNWLVQL